MDDLLRTTVWKQCGAAIDMLGNAIRACPEQVWGDRTKNPEYWYVAYHTIFWLDYYSSESVDGFTPPKPFGLEEMDPAGLLPDRVYSKEELLIYLEYGRQKCRKAVLAMTDENAHQNAGAKRPEVTNIELLLYSMRHIQHHAAQLNLMLRQTIDDAPRWVTQTKSPLSSD
jgi:hypothetical protein